MPLARLLFTTAATRAATVAVGVAILMLGEAGGRAWAQELFTEQATLLPSDVLPVFLVRDVSIDGNTALVTGSRRVDPTPFSAFVDAAYVFERDQGGDAWRQVANLTPAGLVSISAIDIDHDTALVSGWNGSPVVMVFERNAGGPNAWGQVATLRDDQPGSDPGQEPFGVSVSIDGDTAVIGDLVSSGAYHGSVHVYERNRGGSNAWGQVATLRSDTVDPRLGDLFGWTVAISGDTVVVGGVEPMDTRRTCFSSGTAHVFGRHQGGPNAWGLVTKLPFTEPPYDRAFPPRVSIDGDTAVLGTSRRDFGVPLHSTSAHVFDRNRGGPNAWGKVATLVPVDGPVFSDLNVSISGSTIAVTSIVSDTEPGVVHVYARHQGGANAWGLVGLLNASEGSWTHGTVLSVSGDTVLTGDPARSPSAAFVFVSDVDGDGLRDGADPCPRDPLNNIAGQCRRSTASSPAVDTQMALSNLTAVSVSGDYAITGTFTNTSQTAIRNPFFVVTELSGGNLLKNADGGASGVGATLSPDVGNGVLEPGESTRVTFMIKLATRNPFRFLVNVRGDPEP